MEGAFRMPPSADTPPAMERRPSGHFEEDDFLEAARRTVAAAEEANKAACEDAGTPKTVRQLTTKSLEEAQAMLQAAIASPRFRKRQGLAEFATMLGEEVKEAAEESLQEGIEYAERTLRKAKSLVEDHFMIDDAFRMLGPLRQDSNLARDVHDWFNLVALLPVIVFNFWNWSCTAIPLCGLTTWTSVPSLWHGEHFSAFWWTTFAYFVIDALWMVLLPMCVRSPDVIIKHHIATLAYIFIPYNHPRFAWFMGANMIVEVNTWFLIARRSFNKNGDKMFSQGVPLTKSLRLLAVSSCFYVSWFVIRLGLYPLLLVLMVQAWWDYSSEVGSYLNIIGVTPVMQCIFIFLNVKWTIDLIRSKLKGRGTSKGL